LSAERLNQVVNIYICSGDRLKSSHTQRPSYSIAIYIYNNTSSRHPFDSILPDVVQDVYCVYTSYNITIRSDRRLAYCWDSIVRQKLIWSNREILRSEHHYTWFTLYMYTRLLHTWHVWARFFKRNILHLIKLSKKLKISMEPNQWSLVEMLVYYI